MKLFETDKKKLKSKKIKHVKKRYFQTLVDPTDVRSCSCVS